MKIAKIISGIICIMSISAFAQFGDRTDCGVVDCRELDEASGIAAGRANKDVLWTHNDSGDKSRIFAISTTGVHLATVYFTNIQARDWEDIAIGPGPEDGKSYIYISETGDNDAEYDIKTIYRFIEPQISEADTQKIINVSDVDKIKIRYADGKRDAEALMVDPLTKDCYVISKREMNVRYYRIPYPQNTDSVSVVELTDSISLSMIVAADISPDGCGILMKNYHKIYYWKRKNAESIHKALKRKPLEVSYVKEPQGEAVCWAEDGNGYFTISEAKKKNKDGVHLYFYPAISR